LLALQTREQWKKQWIVQEVEFQKLAKMGETRHQGFFLLLSYEFLSFRISTVMSLGPCLGKFSSIL